MKRTLSLLLIVFLFGCTQNINESVNSNSRDTTSIDGRLPVSQSEGNLSTEQAQKISLIGGEAEIFFDEIETVLEKSGTPAQGLSEIYIVDDTLYYLEQYGNTYSIYAKNLITEEESILYETSNEKIYRFIVLGKTTIITENEISETGSPHDGPMSDCFYLDLEKNISIPLAEQYVLEAGNVTNVQYDGTYLYIEQAPWEGTNTIYTVAGTSESTSWLIETGAYPTRFCVRSGSIICMDNRQRVLLCQAGVEAERPIAKLSLPERPWKINLFNEVFHVYYPINQASYLASINLRTSNVSQPISSTAYDKIVPMEDSYNFESRYIGNGMLHYPYISVQICNASYDNSIVRTFPAIEIVDSFFPAYVIDGNKLYYLKYGSNTNSSQLAELFSLGTEESFA